MHDLTYKIVLEIERPMNVLGPLPVAKIAVEGRLYAEEDAASQLRRECQRLVARMEPKLKKAAGKQMAAEAMTEGGERP